MHRRLSCQVWITLVALFAMQPLQANAQESPGPIGPVVTEPEPVQVLPTPPADVPSQAVPAPVPPTPVVYPTPYSPQTPEETLRMQLDARRLELRDLSRAGRPEYYVRRRVLGFAAIGAGAASTGLSTFVVWVSAGPDSLGLTSGQQVLLGAGVLGGLSVLAVGIWAVTSPKRNNLYRERILQLRNELDGVNRELKEARRARKRSAQYSLSPAASFERGPSVLLRLSVRI